MMVRVFEAVARFMAWCSGAAMIGAAFVVSADVILRKFAGYSIPAVDEFSAYCFAIAITWAYAYAAITNANIRIDFPYITFPERLRLALDVVALTALVLFLSWLFYRAVIVAEVSHDMDSRVLNPLRLHLAAFQVAWAIGIFAGALAAMLVLFRLVLALKRGDIATARQLGGSGGSPSGDNIVI